MILSIIVPVYNVEVYLRKCVDSILAQTFTDFELILVDDGSPDGCPAICDEYAEKDQRVRVIHKENGGISSARNAGLDVAQGDYIGFVDSDDYILPDMYRILIKNANQYEACISAVGYYEVLKNGAIYKKCAPERMYVLKREDLVHHFYPENRWLIMPGVTTKVYLRSIFKQLRFPEGYVYEDSFLQLPIFDSTNVAVISDEALYCYLIERSDSIMRSSFSTNNLQLLDLADFRYNFFRKRGLKEQCDYALDGYTGDYLRISLGVRYLDPALRGNMKEYNKVFRKRLPEISMSQKVCRMKKLIVLLNIVAPFAALRLTRKYFPECLPVELR